MPLYEPAPWLCADEGIVIERAHFLLRPRLQILPTNDTNDWVGLQEAILCALHLDTMENGLP
jgi:hypothetical protein